MINWGKKNKHSVGTKPKNKEWEEELILSLAGGGGVGWGHRGWCRKAIYSLCAAARRRGGAEEGNDNKPGRFSLPEGLLARMKSFSFYF